MIVCRSPKQQQYLVSYYVAEVHLTTILRRSHALVVMQEGDSLCAGTSSAVNLCAAC